MDGLFKEKNSDRHVRLRFERLESGFVDLTVSSGSEQHSLERLDLDESLADAGFVVLDFDVPLTTNDYLEFGRRLGEPLPENDEAVLPFVESEVVLNVISRFGRTDDVSLQPFAANAIALHTESSGKPVDGQPRYITLMCESPGDAPMAARTMIVPMPAVAKLMDEEDLAILRRTRYRRHGPDLTIVRQVDGRSVFCFRDFTVSELEWSFDGDDVEPTRVNTAISSLLSAMYQADPILVHWRRGRLVVLDNMACFHGREASREFTAQPRHLKRLRLSQRGGH